MKLSFFTPTHKPTYIAETYQSLLNQKFNPPFEWIIVPNNGVKESDLPNNIREDKRVRILPSELTGIGALKNYACHQCSGDVFVELDHDDILASDAADELCRAFEKVPDGFYYSDFINVKENGKCETFDKKFGWETYDTVVDGKSYKACRAFEPSARSVCQIYYAPNHVRAWSRKAYMQTKGHDVTLTVGDDHDLICRTYIQGTPFALIRKPLYIYRRYGDNSFMKYNKEIQIQQRDNMYKYLHQLVESECSRRGLRKYDFGRSTRARQGFYTYDYVAADGMTGDIPENSVGCIRAYDTLQRIPMEKIPAVMNAFYRMLAPGGWLLTGTPSIDDGEGRPGRGAYQDPSHVSFWSQNNFLYYTHRKFADLVPEYKGRFQQVTLRTYYPNDWHRQHFVPYVYCDMSALKGQRQAGFSEI